MGSLASVRAAAVEILATESRIDVLIDNAGAIFPERTIGPDGIEATLGTLVVGPFALIGALLPLLAGTPGSRVIAVTSGGQYAQAIDVDDLEDGAGPYNGTRAYARAKRAQVTLIREWARRLGPAGIRFDSMHPGWADTPGLAEALPGFARLMGPLLRSPREGTDTLIWLATTPALHAPAGSLWLDRRPRPFDRLPMTRLTSSDRRRLWHRVVAMSGLPEPEPSPDPIHSTPAPGGPHDHAHGADRHHRCPSRTPSPTSPTSRTRPSGTRASRPPSASIPGPVGLGSRFRLGVRLGGRVAPMEYRISVFEPPTASSCSSGPARASRRSTTSASSRDRRRHPGRLHGRHPAGWPAPSGPAVPGSARSPTLGRNAVGGMQRTLDARAAAIGRRRRGRRVMKVAIVGAGRQRPDRRLCPARDHEVRLFEAEAAVGGHVKTVAVETEPGRSPSTPASSSTTSTPTRRSSGCSPSWASRRSPATCPLARPVGRVDVEFSSRGLARLLRHARVRRPARRTGG